MILLFFLFNLYICIPVYLYLTGKNFESITERAISTVVLVSAQIIFSQLLLGLIGYLSLTLLLVFNILISLAVLYFALKGFDKLKSVLKNDLEILSRALRSIYAFIPNIFLTVLILLTSLWLILSSIMLPPRGIDDLVYHLSPLYEFIINGEIFLLPLRYRTHFAFPFNAEFLFMWPTIFQKNLELVGMVQYAYGLVGILVTYALGKTLDLNSKISFFVAQLFFLTPVVLTQAGSAYIDLIVSVFFMISLFYVIKFYLTRRTGYAYLSAVSIGLLIGMKYHMLYPAFILCLFTVYYLFKTKRAGLVLYSFLIIICSGYWYIRNALVFKNPVYPLPLFNPKKGMWKEGVEISSPDFISGMVDKIDLLFFKDIGIGTFHGGLGIIFWGIAVPCWIYFLIKSVNPVKGWKIYPLFLWLQLLVGMSVLFLVPLKNLQFDVRYAIFVLPVGLLAVGMAIQVYRDIKVYRWLIILLCCVFSFAATFQLAASRLPSYAVNIPITDKLEGKDYSPMRYLRLSSFINSMSFLWETLDYITLNGGGLNCYFFMSSIDYSAPFYGSKLQNRIWNFDMENTDDPDCFLYYIGRNQRKKYIKKKITLEETANNPDYILVDSAYAAHFFLHKKFLEPGSDIYNGLANHYKNYYEKQIGLAYNLSRSVKKGVPIVTYSDIGFGFRYLNQTGILDNPVYVTTENGLEELMKRNNFENVYTVSFTPGGYRNETVKEFRYDRKKARLIYNEREK